MFHTFDTLFCSIISVGRILKCFSLCFFFNINVVYIPFIVQVLVITEKVTRIAAGSYHSVALTASGKIYTWGYNGKYQLGRQGPAQDAALAKVEIELWYSFPAPIPGLGAAHGKTVTWVGASADQTVLKLDESLINAQNLVGATICANKHQVLILPTHNMQPTSFHSLCISRSDGFCRSFSALDQV